MGDDSATTTTTNPNSPTTKKSSSLFLQIIENPDGSITRPAVPLVPPSSNPNVLSKDVPLNPENDTWLRLYLPNPPPPKDKKLPIVVYLHGGGFVLFSPDCIFYHVFCEQTAAALPAIVVSLHYRLSPEHRLPAAYEDAVDALCWLRRTSADPWIDSHGDLSRCFLTGSSSGGNIAYHAGLRVSTLNELKLAGLVMIQPYFGGEISTESEKESEEDPMLPLRANKMMWRMALPEGADRDHEYCNPATKPAIGEGIVLPRVLVTGCKGDPLFDRQGEFVRMLEEKVEVVAAFDDNGYHAIELFEPARAEALIAVIREFVYGSGCELAG